MSLVLSSGCEILGLAVDLQRDAEDPLRVTGEEQDGGEMPGSPDVSPGIDVLILRLRGFLPLLRFRGTAGCRAAAVITSS